MCNFLLLHKVLLSYRYFYTGEIDLSEDNVVPLMILANKYIVIDLEKACELFVLNLVFNGTPIDQIINWWVIAGQLNLRVLRRKCHEYMILNMDMVLRSDMFLDFDFYDVQHLLKERNLVVSKEINLYCSVWKWISQPQRKEKMAKYFKELMSPINFTMMSTEELINIDSKLPNELKSLISEQLLNAFKFHATAFEKRAQMGLAKCDSPRLYTNSRGHSLSAGVALDGNLRPFLRNGIPHQVAIPVSLSEADKNNVRDWKLVFQETDEAINLEISTATAASEQFGMIEASVLLYKTVNKIQFVKGVMQFRIFQRISPSIGKAGHVFSVLIPPAALEENNQCLYRLVTRHYHDKQFVRNILQRKSPQVAVNNIDRTD